MDDKQDNQIVVKSECELEKTVNYLLFEKEKYAAEFQLIIMMIITYGVYLIAPGVVRVAVLAYVLALLVDPFVSKLEGRFSRIFGFVVVLSIFVGFIALLFGFLLPVIVSEYSGFITKVPDLTLISYTKLQHSLHDIFGVYVLPSQARIKDSLASIIPKLSSENLNSIFLHVWDTLFAGYTATLTIVNLMILPLLLFYFIKDWRKVNKSILFIIPKKYKSFLSEVASQVVEILNSFARGQVLVSLALVVLYSLALLLINLPYALPIGIVAGILGVIPYVGLAIGIVLALLVQGVSDPTLFGLLSVVIAFTVVQAIESNLITPKIVGETMGLHPLVVILALLVGGSAFGILGLLLAIPVSAILRLFVQKYSNVPQS